MSIGTRIKEKRLELGFTQEELANKLGYKSKSTINKIEMDINDIPQSKVVAFANALNTTIAYLMGWEDDPSPDNDYSDVKNLIHPSAYRIPIVGKICAGDGCFVIEEKMGYFTIDHTIKADFALVVKGDSMIDIDINDGDIVLIKKVFDYYDGKIYAIRLIDENEATIKRCYFEEDKVIMQPCNPEFKPMIADGKNVSVVGECVGVYHAL